MSRNRRLETILVYYLLEEATRYVEIVFGVEVAVAVAVAVATVTEVGAEFDLEVAVDADAVDGPDVADQSFRAAVSLAAWFQACSIQQEEVLVPYFPAAAPRRRYLKQMQQVEMSE